MYHGYRIAVRHQVSNAMVNPAGRDRREGRRGGFSGRFLRRRSLIRCRRINLTAEEGEGGRRAVEAVSSTESGMNRVIYLVVWLQTRFLIALLARKNAPSSTRLTLRCAVNGSE
jgi:hypothetical protein